MMRRVVKWGILFLALAIPTPVASAHSTTCETFSSFSSVGTMGSESVGQGDPGFNNVSGLVGDRELSVEEHESAPLVWSIEDRQSNDDNEDGGGSVAVFLWAHSTTDGSLEKKIQLNGLASGTPWYADDVNGEVTQGVPDFEGIGMNFRPDNNDVLFIADTGSKKGARTNDSTEYRHVLYRLIEPGADGSALPTSVSPDNQYELKFTKSGVDQWDVSGQSFDIEGYFFDDDSRRHVFIQKHGSDSDSDGKPEFDVFAVANASLQEGQLNEVPQVTTIELPDENPTKVTDAGQQHNGNWTYVRTYNRVHGWDTDEGLGEEAGFIDTVQDGHQAPMCSYLDNDINVDHDSGAVEESLTFRFSGTGGTWAGLMSTSDKTTAPGLWEADKQ